MINTSLNAGFPFISSDTSARIMAVLFCYGNNEQMVYNPHLRQDLEYIQRRFGVIGGERPDADFVELVKEYVQELEDYEEEHKDEQTSGALFTTHCPRWAKQLFKERYGIKLIN